jgi:molybdopterin-guanine dinucleotide biosynthesis protein A
MPIASCVAVILAGGKARRMGGGDKPLLEVGGGTMLSRIIAVVREDVTAIAISANGDPARFAEFGLPVLPDGQLSGEGPLAGVLAGLGWARGLGASALLTVPGDTPFVPRGLVGALSPAPACAASNGHVHHLVALWPVGCREELRAVLSAPGRRDVGHFAQLVGMRRVDFPMAKWDAFMNVNTPGDLTVARAIAEGET